MRTVTTTTTLYKFNELSPKAQDKAVEKLYDINVDHDWWDGIYEDANRVGIEILEFDTGRGSYCKIGFTRDAESVAKAILKEHGESCDTHKLAKDFLEEIDPVRDFDAEEEERTVEEFRRALSEEYLFMLRKGYEYLTSREAIVETIEANDYEFTEDGKLA